MNFGRIFKFSAVHEIRHLLPYEIIDHAERKRLKSRMDKFPCTISPPENNRRLTGMIAVVLTVFINDFPSVEIEMHGTRNRRRTVQQSKMQTGTPLLFECGKDPDTEIQRDITGLVGDFDFTGHFQRQHAGDPDAAVGADIAVARGKILMRRLAADRCAAALIGRDLVKSAERGRV